MQPLPKEHQEIHDMWNRAFSLDREKNPLDRLLLIPPKETIEPKTKTVAECAEEKGWCQKLVDDVANYYKKLIQESIPYLEQAQTGSKADLIRLKFVIDRFKSESYGAK